MNTVKLSPLTCLYVFTLSGGQRKQIVVKSKISELDAHAKAFASLNMEERNTCVKTELKTISV